MHKKRDNWLKKLRRSELDYKQTGYRPRATPEPEGANKLTFGLIPLVNKRNSNYEISHDGTVDAISYFSFQISLLSSLIEEHRKTIFSYTKPYLSKQSSSFSAYNSFEEMEVNNNNKRKSVERKRENGGEKEEDEEEDGEDEEEKNENAFRKAFGGLGNIGKGLIINPLQGVGQKIHGVGNEIGTELFSGVQVKIYFISFSISLFLSHSHSS